MDTLVFTANNRGATTWIKSPGSGAFAARAGSVLLSFKGEMWLIGGSIPGTSTYLNDVWHSSDGIVWHEVKNTPWQPRHAASVFVHDQALWMVAGNNMEPDVWKLRRIAN